MRVRKNRGDRKGIPETEMIAVATDRLFERIKIWLMFGIATRASKTAGTAMNKTEKKIGTQEDRAILILAPETQNLK